MIRSNVNRDLFSRFFYYDSLIRSYYYILYFDKLYISC